MYTDVIINTNKVYFYSEVSEPSMVGTPRLTFSLTGTQGRETDRQKYKCIQMHTKTDAYNEQHTQRGVGLGRDKRPQLKRIEVGVLNLVEGGFEKVGFQSCFEMKEGVDWM